MSTSVTFNGTGFVIPAVGDANWGVQVSAYLIAVSTGSLQKTGGAFTLSAADVAFGASYGLQAIYYKSNTANIAGSGVLRLATSDAIAWRNAGNSADLLLALSGNVLQFNSISLADISSTQTLTNKTMDGGSNTFTNLPATGLTGIVAPANGGTGVANNSASTITVSGSFPITATLTASTSVTFPTSGTLATRAGSETLTNKTLTAPVIATIENTGTLTLPTATDTLVGRTTTDTLTNKTIAGASNTLTVRAASDVTGQLPIANGGTGQTTATAAINALLPSQTSNNGKVLSTDGTNTSWASALTSTLNQYNTFVGNASNAATATNTNLLGSIIANTSTASVTFTNATPTVVTWTGHGLSTGATVYFTAGTMPTGVTASTTYYVIKIDADTFNISTTLANALAATKVAATSTGTTVVGFSGGLNVGANGIPGALTGTTVAGGYFGEKLSSTNGGNSLTAGTIANIASLSITAGVWRVRGFAYMSGAASQSQLMVGVSTDSTSSTFSDEATAASPGNANVTHTACSGSFDFAAEVHRYINISSTTTYYLKSRVLGANGTVGGYIEAVRIA